MTTGFSFGSFGAAPAATTSASTGFSFGATTQATTSATGFGSLSTPATTASAPSLGFGLGGVKPTATTVAAATGFSFGGSAATTSTGFSLGQTTAPATAPVAGFSLGGPVSSVPSTGLALGAASTSAASTGFSLGGTTTTSSTGGLFGGLQTGKTELGNPVANPTPSTTLGGLGPTPGLGVLAPTSGLGGLAPITTTTVGLGGVDPSTITTSAGGTIGATKLGISDGKAVKEEKVHAVIMTSVENFKKFVKEEKAVRENISRMSTKPMYKVQEDFIGLKQLLSELSNCLQRNSCTVGKLKAEMTETLKAAEMAQATHETPPGLQYGNTEPTVYFQKLVEKFENNMQMYRQQIETLESHLVATQQSNRLTPNDLVNVMKKLHEAFVVLAAQVYEVNQAVKTQKEHFLNYQRVFHGESKDIFELNRKLQTTTSPDNPKGMLGPTPFSGMSSAAAMAMASALTRSQQLPVAQPPTVGLASNTLGGGNIGGFGSTGFGAANTGTGLFGATATATAQPSTAATGFGFGGLNTATSTANTSFGFGTPLPNQPTLPPAYGAQPANQPFQLGKPPVGGSKKGKR